MADSDGSFPARRPGNLVTTAIFAGFLMASLAGLAGCQTAAVAISAVQGGPTNAAAYALPEARTAILVDDPQQLLEDPSIARQIGTTAMFYLEENKALKEEHVVPPRAVVRLQNMAGRAWSRMPIDEIGRRLEAQQMIYVKVVQIRFRTDEQLYRPEIALEIKVIDATTGERLWPEAPPLLEAGNAPPGQRVAVQLDYETRAGRFADDATPGDLARRLADEAGLAVARLFYDWKPDPVGSDL